MVCIRKSYIVYLEIYVVPIGHGFSFFWSWKSHGKSMLKKKGHPVINIIRVLTSALPALPTRREQYSKRKINNKQYPPPSDCSESCRRNRVLCLITLRVNCGAVYCNRSCLQICGCVLWLWVCYHDNSKLRSSILTKLDLQVKVQLIKFWPSRAVGKGVCGGA